MDLNKRVELISKIGILFRNYINNNINQNNKDSISKLKYAIKNSKLNNSWFTYENINFSLNAKNRIENNYSKDKVFANYFSDFVNLYTS